jgi:hypothetical protein
MPHNPSSNKNRISISTEDLIKLLIKHYDIREGIFSLSFGVVFTGGSVKTQNPANLGDTNDTKILPGFAIGINDIGLLNHTDGKIPPGAVDAAEVNKKSLPKAR